MMKIAAHPGEILKDELDERGLSLSELARQIDVPPGRLSEIVNGKRAVTGDTALRLGHWFGMDPQFWMNLQAQFDLARAEEAAGERIRALPTA
ncbi:MAG: HigA family addiction module antitoxin [Proteobacteria bacterium]|nr:HigA family addiction module antitoxin [Pseudomonadota bacterium]